MLNWWNVGLICREGHKIIWGSYSIVVDRTNVRFALHKVYTEEAYQQGGVILQKVRDQAFDGNPKIIGILYGCPHLTQDRSWIS